MKPEQAKALREPFPPDLIGKLPKGGAMLDYVGHGAVRDRLLQVDPEWNWEPFALTEEGLPALDEFGNLWIRLTIGGVTRPGVGDGPNMKERIGDAIRNAAMSFGVALDLWIRGGGEDTSRQEQVRRPRRGATSPPAEPADGPISADNAEALRHRCEEKGVDVADVVKKGTAGRTGDPAEVLRSEVPAVKAAIDELAGAPL